MDLAKHENLRRRLARERPQLLRKKQEVKVSDIDMTLVSAWCHLSECVRADRGEVSIQNVPFLAVDADSPQQPHEELA